MFVKFQIEVEYLVVGYMKQDIWTRFEASLAWDTLYPEFIW